MYSRAGQTKERASWDRLPRRGPCSQSPGLPTPKPTASRQLLWAGVCKLPPAQGSQRSLLPARRTRAAGGAGAPACSHTPTPTRSRCAASPTRPGRSWRWREEVRVKSVKVFNLRLLRIRIRGPSSFTCRFPTLNSWAVQWTSVWDRASPRWWCLNINTDARKNVSIFFFLAEKKLGQVTNPVWRKYLHVLRTVVKKTAFVFSTHLMIHI